VDDAVAAVDDFGEAIANPHWQMLGRIVVGQRHGCSALGRAWRFRSVLRWTCPDEAHDGSVAL
jgi:hypothetical protein